MILEITPTRHSLMEVQALLGDLAGQAPTVIARSINKVAMSIRAEIVRRLRAELNLKAKTIREESIGLSKAGRDKLWASVRVFGRRIPLIDWGARQVRRGVSYAIRRGQRKLIAHGFVQTMPGSGHRGVFIRKRGRDVRRALRPLRQRLARGIAGEPGRKIGEGERQRLLGRIWRTKGQELAPEQRAGRLPIQELFGPSLPQVVEDIPELVGEAMERRAGDEVDREVDRQIGLIVERRHGGRGAAA